MLGREFGHIWWPLALRFVRAIIGIIVRGGMVIFIVFLGGKAEGRRGFLDGGCKARRICCGEEA